MSRNRKWEKELLYLVCVAGEGKDIAELSAVSASRKDVEFFEAHEIHDIASASKDLFFYDEKEQTVSLAIKRSADSLF